MMWSRSTSPFLAAVGLALLVAPGVVAAQTISGHSGTVADGQVLTLTGASFGSRASDSASFFETWDWGLEETSVDTLNSPWSVAGPGSTDPARFSEDESRTGDPGDRNLRVILPDRISGSSLNDLVYRQDFEVQPGDRVYISNFLWSTYAGAREGGEGCPQQWKIMNFLAHGPDALGVPHCGITWNAEGAQGDVDGDPQAWISHMCGSGSASVTKIHWDEQPPVETWWQVEIEYKVASSQSAEDGYFRVWFDGQLAGEGPTESWCTDELDAAIQGDGFVYNTATLRNYVQWSGCPAQMDVIRHDDTCYQIGTWARVMIGDAPTWAACTVREYQPIASWNSGQIAVTVNQGAFDNGDQAWIYVVDADGDRSAGYPVTFGSGGEDPGPPGPPEQPIIE